VNVVRFSPSGQYLASGSDDQMVVVWSLKLLPAEFGKTEETVQWGHPRQLRGHVGDIMDICWTRDSSHFTSCSVDGTCILWSAIGGKFGKVQTFDGHKKMVQGVSLDPLTKYLITMSSDATVRGYKNRKLKTNLQFFHKFTLKSREEELVGNSTAANEVAQAQAPNEDVDMIEESAPKDN
jgi:WD40 repeat protein